MSLRWLIAVFLYLIPTTSTTVLSLSDLEGRAARISLKDNNPTESHQEQLQEQQQDNVKICESPLSLEAIIKQGDALRASTLADNINDVVRKLDSKLSELIDSGVSPLDATSIINSFFNDARDLVLTAIKVKAFTLLKLLQIIYIWRDKAQFHWFQALGYESEWYDKTFWCIHPMNWRDNIQAICEWNNAALILKVQKDILSDDVSPEDILNFNKEVWMLCIKYDAIKVFEALRFDPIQLGLHLELLATRSSAKLLSLYQTASALEHLHLERFPFPKKLAASVRDFKFLMKHGQNFFPMSRFIGMFCEKGRLDLLKYLHSLEKTLLPDHQDLEIVAKKDRMEIIQWSQSLGVLDVVNSDQIILTLAINYHFQTLDWLLNAGKMIIGDCIIRKIAKEGALEALQWIDEKQPIKKGQKEWANVAAEKYQLPVLKWLYNRFGLLPSHLCLGNTTVEILEWIKATDESLINADVGNYGGGNLEPLQWVFKNVPISVLEDKKARLARNISNRKTMKWLYKKLQTCPADMDWAYKLGDLKAIKWALNTCQVFPTDREILYAARGGQLHIIKWIHKNYSTRLKMPRVFQNAMECGSLNVAEYLMSVFALDMKMKVRINQLVGADQYLDTLKWAHKHGFDINPSAELHSLISRRNPQIFKWLLENFPSIQPESTAWDDLVYYNHHESYEQLLSAHPNRRRQDKLIKDLESAYKNGHLGIVKVILNQHPLLFKTIPEIKTTVLNCHVKQWLAWYSSSLVRT